ncbi:matrix metalloproteinase-2 [Octopus sinensis]|uniref:Matrix metalloproteinase-2 n=1 Tax=Octopus sinensis TaxID=2607531 RepID=A0A6P7TWW5_9MOLL|nr:matrix metalloproteinase-2 [Octopus sinensis]
MLVFPRCGVKDIIRRNGTSQHYNFQAVGKWNKNDLTWNVSRYHAYLDIDLQMETINKAFQYWSNVTNLTFRPPPLEEPDIDIQFIREEHGDGNPFDGRGSNAAHAFFPGESSISGDAHFDEDEEWSLYQNGTNLLAVAVHEFGHSLGLGHSRSPGSVMSPFFEEFNENFTLHADDIKGIQSLYKNDPHMEINNTVTSTSTISSLTNSLNISTIAVTSDPLEDLNGTIAEMTSETSTAEGTKNSHRKRCHGNTKNCKSDKNRRKHNKKQKNKSKKVSKKSERRNTGSDEVDGEYNQDNENGTSYSLLRNETGHVKKKICHLKFDAVVDGLNNKTYAFRNEYIYEVASFNIKRRKIRALFRKAPANVSSAVFHPATKELLIFKGKHIWKYNGKKLKKGYPKNITDPRYREPSASVLWYTGLILQFKDDMFWFLDERTLTLSDGYPKFSGVYWPNLPLDVDAAVWYKQNNIYFFKDTNYYKLDIVTRSIENGYPQEIAPYWLNCRNKKRSKKD